LFFIQAEKVAQQLGISRSELYSQAIANFIKSYRSQKITDVLNQVYAQEDSDLDERVAAVNPAFFKAEIIFFPVTAGILLIV